MPPIATAVDTGKVTGRRVLRYNSPADLEADVARLAAAERSGKLTQVGNWSLGQALGHLGAWVNFAFDGNPIKAPWIIRLIVGRKKNTYLNLGLPAGVRIPRVEGGTVAIEPLSLEVGLCRFSEAWDRLKKILPDKPNALFGPLTHQEWINLNLRHAELHLSFMKPQ